MDLFDSFKTESAWINSHDVGLENTLWESFSDKGNDDYFFNYCKGLQLIDFNKL